MNSTPDQYTRTILQEMEKVSKHTKLASEWKAIHCHAKFILDLWWQSAWAAPKIQNCSNLQLIACMGDTLDWSKRNVERKSWHYLLLWDRLESANFGNCKYIIAPNGPVPRCPVLILNLKSLLALQCHFNLFNLMAFARPCMVPL